MRVQKLAKSDRKLMHLQLRYYKRKKFQGFIRFGTCTQLYKNSRMQTSNILVLIKCLVSPTVCCKAITG